MKWIKYNYEPLPEHKNLIYACVDWSPYTIEKNNGSPEFYTTGRYPSEMFNSVIAYAVIEDYEPTEDDFNTVNSWIRKNKESFNPD